MADSLLLCTDLFFVSRIKGAAEKAGFEMTVGKTIEKITLRDTISLVIVDLVSAGSTPGAISEIVREQLPGARLVGFGPHVQIARLDAARAAGFDGVLTRGQLDHGLNQLFD